MEEKILKLAAQLTVIFVIAFIVVKLFAPAPPPPRPRPAQGQSNRWAKGDMWNRSGVPARSQSGVQYSESAL